MRTIAHLSDLHFGRHSPMAVESLLRALGRLSPHLAIVSGDLTQRARPEQFAAARAFLDRLPCPWLAVLGNHDIPLYDLAARLRAPTKRFRRFIDPRRTPEFRDDEMAVLGLPTSHSLSFQMGWLKRAHAHLAADWIDALPERLFSILVMHHPPGWPFPWLGTNKVFPSRPPDALLCGHVHLTGVDRTKAKRFGETVLVRAGTTLSRRLRSEEKSFCVLRFDETDVEVETWRYQQHDFVPEAPVRFARRGAGR